MDKMADKTAIGWCAFRAHWGSWDILDDEGNVIATVDDRYSGGIGEMSVAEERAFKIAAAPALYDALTTLVNYLDDQALWFDSPAQVESMESHIARARAALTAAAPAANEGQADG